MRAIFIFTALLLLAAVQLTGCTAAAAPAAASANVVAALSGEVDKDFARAYQPIEFQFPRDHGAHPTYQTEWWYYTGNLQSAEGQEYGFQLTIFRSALTPEAPQRTSSFATNQVYMGHFALTDVEARRHDSFERFSRGAGGLAGAEGDPNFLVWLDDWSVRTVAPDTFRMLASAEGPTGTVAIDLLLRQTRAPVLHGDAGLSQKGPEPGNASHYYSLVGLETSGTVTSQGKTVAVTGRSWMDHEFGTSALSENAVGWDWFSLQLDNGAALMFAQIRTEDGGALGDFKGTLIYPDGRQQVIGAEDFTVAPKGMWTSPETGIAYPSGWVVALPRFGIDLTVEPLIPNQEMRVSYLYWEGAVSAAGSMDGRPVQGRGYVELTGYGSPGGEFQR